MEATSETLMPCDGWDGPCDRQDARRRRQNTNYTDDRYNWVTLCPRCAKANEAYWADMWADLCSGCV